MEKEFVEIETSSESDLFQNENNFGCILSGFKQFILACALQEILLRLRTFPRKQKRRGT